ncbi:MAG: TolC family protein [Paludibacter sp.]|jgi:outer membrane protein|nr:TolC family protein [Paludibacter sp.]
MMKTKLTIVLLSIAVAGIHVSASPKVLSLEQCIDSALTYNRNIRQQELNRASREIAYEQARANLLPNLNASAGQSFMFGRSLIADNTYRDVNSSQSSFGIGSNVTLFDGMRMKYNIEARRAELLASKADLEKIKEDIRLNVTVAYLQVLLLKENRQTAVSQLELSRQKVEQRSALVAAGKLPEGELFELNAQLAKEELNLTRVDTQLKLALLDLAQIIELNDFENLDVELPAAMKEAELKILSANEVYQSALLSRPELKAAEYRLQGSLKNVEIARAAYLPTLNFGAQVSTGYYNLAGVPNNSFSQQSRDNLSTNLGFNLQIPIFNRFTTRNQVANSKLAVENSRIEIENTRIQLRKTIEQAYQNALAAQARLSAARRSERASQEAYRYAEQKYEAGRASVYDLYSAKANLAQAISELSQSKYEYILRINVLELLK